jgi:L-asparaginase/beta-aspartyl-peptidase (threonine type)
MQVLLHGGAGGSPDDPESRRAELDEAAALARDAETPVGAVKTGVGHLEAAPAFNAGIGGAVQSDGTVRTDAGVMTGDGSCGAACAMPGVAHAVDVAEAVATETPHVLLAGEGAVTLADEVGVATDRDLLTAETRDRWAAVDPPPRSDPGAHRAWVREHFGGRDTVGAVATDGETLAAATSTGGRWFALPGRVGDVPQVGAGFYATAVAAASATGAGEAIARFGLAREAVAAVAEGRTPARAAAVAVEDFEAATGETAGVIVVGRDGGTGGVHNAEAMQTAVPTD